MLLLAIGFLIYYWPHLALPTSTIGGNLHVTISTNFLDHAYAAVVPGPGCDVGAADWTVGDHFKTIVTPTAGATTVSPQETPTLQVIADNSTVATCQQNGVLVKHNDHFDAYATVFFLYSGGGFEWPRAEPFT